MLFFLVDQLAVKRWFLVIVDSTLTPETQLQYYPYTHDEPHSGYPFQGVFRPWNSSWQLGRFNPSFWRHVERRVEQLRDMGVIAEIILFHPYDGGHWGFDRMNQYCSVPGPHGGTGTFCNLNYVKYATARLAGFRNVWWSMANEFDIEKSITMADWDALFVQLRASDPYDKERSIHNCVNYYNHSQPWISHISLQGHDVSQLDMAKKTWGHPQKPIVWDETMYEGNITYSWGALTAKEQSQRFWTAASNGAHCAGHSNTALLPLNMPNCSDPNNNGLNGKPMCNPVMWWNKGGVLRGHSPPRIEFYRIQMEGADVPRYDAMSSEKLWEGKAGDQAEGVYHLFANDGSWHLVYWLGTTQPVDVPLTKGGSEERGDRTDATYSVKHLDYWNMTVTPLADVTGSTLHVAPPVEHYILKIAIEK